MTVDFTNKQLAEYAEILFSHTNAYFFPALFANREKSKAFLKDKIKDNETKPIIISDILGSGKTVLMDMVKGELGFKDTRPLIAGRTKPDQINTDALLFIYEWDIKANPKRLLKTMKQIQERNKSNPGPLVLLGDYTLKSENFIEWLAELGQPQYVPMEPLSPDFFELALRQRLQRATSNIRHEGNIEYQNISFIQSALITALVPDLETTSANFREVFAALMEMSYELPLNNEPARMTDREARIWLQKREPQGMSKDQDRFFKAYLEHLRSMVKTDGWSAVKPLDENTLIEKTGFSNLDLQDFREKIIEPLARTPGIIAAMGYPEISRDGAKYHRFPGPYLPGTYTRILCAFGDDS